MLKRRGNTWYLDVTTPDGIRRRVSTGTHDKAEATASIPRIMDDLLGRAAAEAPGSITLSDGFQKLYNEEWRHTSDASGVKLRMDEIALIVGRDKPIADITRTTLVQLQGALSALPGKGGKLASPSTVNRKMCVIVKLLNVAHRDWEVINAPPRVRPLPTTEKLIRALTEEEVQTLFKVTPTKFHRTWTFLIESGVRIGELVSLEWDNFDLDRGQLSLSPSESIKLKSNRGRRVPLTSSMVDDLRRSQDAGQPRPFPLTRWEIKGAWNRARKKMGMAGDRGFVPHSLRHTCATRLIANGVPTSTVQKWLGHANIATTTLYLNQSVDDMAQYTDAVKVVQKMQLRAVQ